MNIDNPSVSNSVTERNDYDLFISYSRRDKEFVRQLWQALTQANQKTWVDWNDIPPITDWRQEIYLGIETANHFVFILSSHSIASEVCAEELAYAIKQGKRLVPIVRQDIDFQKVHPELARINAIYCREIDDFDSALQTLLRAMETDITHVRTHTRLLVRAREWENTEHDSSFLLRGSDLEAAEQWLAQNATNDPKPTSLHQDYINSSRVAESKRQEAELTLRRMTPQQAHNRQALLNKVRNYWVKGVLQTSLHDQILIELSLEERSEAVIFPWNIELKSEHNRQKSLPQKTKIIFIFDQMGEGRTLLILGEPGAGKTTTLLELTNDLISRAEQSIDYPIPVVFNLSSWLGEKQKIADWLVEELNTKYQVPKTIGQAWIKEQQLLLLLDGLDEVRAEDRELCVNALNTFHQDCGLEMVVCSRIKDYEALSIRLNFQSAIYLRSLTPLQVHHYLESGGSDLTGLKALIEKDSALQELAKSPLMLNIMTMAYQGIAVQDLPATGLLEERRRQLFDAYIEKMFKRRGGNQPYSKVQVMHWLTWLAQRMSQFSQTVFLIEGMQPNWLQTAAECRTYRIGVKLLLMTIWGSLHVGLLAGLKDNPLTFDIFKSSQGLIYGLLGGLVYGLIGGLLGGLVNKSTNHLIGRSINGLLLGIIYAPIFVWLDGWKNGISYGIIYGLIGFIIYGIIHNAQAIEPVNTLKWSKKKAIKYSILGIIIGLVLMFGTGEKLLPSIIFGLMISLIFGFEKTNEVDKRTLPNQSIWKSVANTGKLFVTIGLPTALLLGIVVSPIFGLANGLMFGLAAGLIGGQGAGITCIKHFVLRCILWRSGCIPWNYAQFLDYSANLIFLQKVGGSYVFIHRLLLEHFAQFTVSRSPTSQISRESNF